MWTIVASPFSDLEASSVWMYQGRGRYRKRPLFMRDHLASKATALDEFVRDDSNCCEMYMTGAPGCGKTTFVSYWARNYAAANKKRVLFVNYREKRECSVFVTEGSCLKKYNAALDKTELVDTVKKVLSLEKEGFNLCIFDGVRESKEVCSDLLSIINTQTGGTGKIGKSIHVTSLSFVIRGGDVNMGYGTEISKVYFDSWAMDGHKAAFKDFNERGVIDEELKKDIIKLTAFDVDAEEEKEAAAGDVAAEAGKDTEGSEQVLLDAMAESEDEVTITDAGMTESKDEVTITDAMIEVYVDRKFHLAGGSVRLMFEYTYDAVKAFLKDEIGRVQDWEQFTLTAIAARSSDSVNNLMQQFMASDSNQKCTPLSHYVLMEAYERCRNKLVDAVNQVADACGNPALQGWAFELKQLELVRNAMLANSAEPKKRLSADKFSYVPASEAEYDGKILRADSLHDVGGVIWCLKWDQGCFDVAFYSNKTLITIQFTVADEHSLKLEYIKELRSALLANNKEVSTIVHVGIVDGSVRLFKFKPPTGAGRSTRGCEVEFEVSVCKSSKLTFA